MDIKNWIEEYGDDALKRAHEEGYQIRRGVGTRLFELLSEELPVSLLTSWDDVEERTSPHSSSFELRDRVKIQCLRVERPAGWHFDVGRISRIKVDGEPLTGVLIRLIDEEHKTVASRVADFESVRSERV